MSKKPKPKYLTAEKLGILPEERTALIAFVTAPSLGCIIAVNGHAHYYDQATVDSKETAGMSDCGTAGCVAGFVIAHAQVVQKKRYLRNAKRPQSYIDEACSKDWATDRYKAPLLHSLYREARRQKLAQAKKVVDRALRTGNVVWPD